MLKEAIKEFPKTRAGITARLVFLQVCSFLSGLLLSRTLVFDSYMPFGIALTAGLKKEHSLTAAAGAILGSIIPANGMSSLRYIGAIFIAASIKWMLSGLYQFTKTASFSAITAGAASGASALLVLLVNPIAISDLLQFTCETLLALSGAYFISLSSPLLNSNRKLAQLSLEELTGAVISISVILMSVASFTIYSLSPARIFSVVVILCAARYGRETVGAITGITLGFAMSITSPNMFFIVGAYALGGLIAGVFSRVNNFGCAMAFILSNAVMIAGFYKDYSVIPEIFEVAAASTIFMVLPRKALATVADFFAPAPSLARADGLRRGVVMRLNFASNALMDVSSTVEEVSDRLRQINSPQLTDVFLKVEDESCKKCGLKIHCFETSKADTYQSFIKMTRLMRSKGVLNIDDLPESWVNRCCHPESVAESLYKHFTAYMSKEAAERRISEIRSVVSDQFNGLSDMLYDMAEEFEEAEKYDTDIANRINSVLRQMGIQSTDISCRIDKYNRMTVEICASQLQNKHINKMELMDALSDACMKKFDAPCVSIAGKKTLITLTEKANYRVDIGVAQYSSGGSKLCGDSYSYFNDGKGRAVMVISDGMGCGGRAAVDSAMASGLMGRLIKAGFGFECSLKLVNSAMLFKSTDESLATIDITSIDLFSGQSDFYKAGSPETLVLKGKKVGRALCKSYPAGILRNVEFDKTSAVLENKDIVLMISDGVASTDTVWIEDELKNFKHGSAQLLAEHIATLAKRRRDDGHEDDITVMVGMIEKEI